MTAPQDQDQTLKDRTANNLPTEPASTFVREPHRLAKTAYIGLALLCLVGVAAWAFVATRDNMLNNSASSKAKGSTLVGAINYETTQLSLSERRFTLDIADTDEKQALGLGQRRALPADHGMLFVYSHPSSQCFWMKDMRFSIDIIWLDADGRVVHIVPSLRPDTYPQTYCPPVDAIRVIELPAGTAKSVGLQVGDEVALE